VVEVVTERTFLLAKEESFRGARSVDGDKRGSRSGSIVEQKPYDAGKNPIGERKN